MGDFLFMKNGIWGDDSHDGSLLVTKTTRVHHVLHLVVLTEAELGRLPSKAVWSQEG